MPKTTKILIALGIIATIFVVWLGTSYLFPRDNGSAPAIYTSSGLFYRSGNMIKTNPSLPITQGRQNVYATTTTTGTMMANELNGYSIVSVTPNTASLTLTLPATSTLSTFVPVAGDITTVRFRNATSTSGVNLTLSVGSGMTFRQSTSTAVVLPGGIATLTFIRKTNTDMDVLFNSNI